jgi:hypothetical protein
MRARDSFDAFGQIIRDGADGEQCGVGTGRNGYQHGQALIVAARRRSSLIQDRNPQGIGRRSVARNPETRPSKAAFPAGRYPLLQ